MVLLLIVLVAAFNIIATLVMVVMERRKEIAILRTMGARAGSVALDLSVRGRGAGRDRHDRGGWRADSLTSFLIGKYHLIHLPADMFMVSEVPVDAQSVELRAGGGGDDRAVPAGARSTRRCKPRGSRRSR